MPWAGSSGASRPIPGNPFLISHVCYPDIVLVKVLFFGMLKDITGRAVEELELAEGSDLADVFHYYAHRFPRIRDYQDSIILARNQEFSSKTEKVSAGDEVAFLPPVSGGCGEFIRQVQDEAGHFFALTRRPIDTQSLRKHVLRGEDGAIVDFVGVVRNNTKGRTTECLDYECYEPMALKMMTEIGRDIAASCAISRIAMVHRLGRMYVGETSVAIVVTAPHRKPAFEAALEGINRLKRLVPIWKKEHFTDGEVWVEGEWDASVLNV